MNKTKQQEHIIWTSQPDFNEWKEDLQADYPEKSEDELYELMYEINNDYLDDERANLNVQLSAPIIVIADLGLWYGRRPGYKEISSGNISDCLYGSGNTEDTWFVDELGDLRCRSAHHDGTNLLLYRVYKPNVSDTQKQNFKEKLLSGQLTRADINRITLRLGDWISDVYGFKIPRKKATASTAA